MVQMIQLTRIYLLELNKTNKLNVTCTIKLYHISVIIIKVWITLMYKLFVYGCLINV